MFERWAEKFKSKKVQEEEIEFKNFDESTKAVPKQPEPTPSYNVAPASIDGNIELVKLTLSINMFWCQFFYTEKQITRG